MTELRAVDLRFSSSEAADFLNRMMRLDLSTEDIAALETRNIYGKLGVHNRTQAVARARTFGILPAV